VAIVLGGIFRNGHMFLTFWRESEMGGIYPG